MLTLTKNLARLQNHTHCIAAASLAVALTLGATPAFAAPVSGEQAGSQVESTKEVDGIQLTETNSNGATYLAVASVLSQISENAVPAMEAVSVEVVEAQAREQAEEEAKTDELLSIAESLTGTPYVYGGSTPAGFDCSGFTQYVYGKMGVSLTHNAQAQYNETASVDSGDLQAGDLVFFGSSTGSISHVGIYVGDGKFIHSPQSGEYVRVDNLSDRSNYVGATRPGL